MQCTNPIRLQPTKRGCINTNGDGLLVPCGKCMACRIKKATEWSMRMQQELMYWDKSAFVTLTYATEHLPVDGTLVPQDLTKFFKRLRKNLGNQKIKYYACGEYGTLYKRPHYHMIIFGVGLSQEDRNVIQTCWPYCDWSIARIRRGSFGLVEPDSIGYVARYIGGKLSGDEAEIEYGTRVRPFAVMSKGLGARWADQYSGVLRDNGYIAYNGTRVSVPRYYINRLALDVDALRQHAIDADCDVTEHYTGVYCTRDVAYRRLDAKLVRSLEQGISAAKLQHDSNIRARYKLYHRDLSID